MKYNTNLKKIPSSELSKFNAYLKNFDDITLLTYGESDYPVDQNIKNELINSLLSNNDKYTSSSGLFELRKNIANIEKEKHNLNINYKNVLITNGSTEAIYLALSSLLNPNDEVILSIPTYPLYSEIVTYLQAKITYINYDENYEIDLDDLLNKISIKTKLIILNYPNNPTGKCLSVQTIDKLGKILFKYKITIILDNVYEDITFVKKNSLVNKKELHDQIIIVNSLSKSKCLTGWRLGYLIANEEIISLSTKLHELMCICNPKFMMDAMNYALTSSTNIDYYKRNCDYVYNFLKKLNLNPIKPDGGFYVCFSIKEFNMDSISFCKQLAKKFKLGLIPGTYFKFDKFIRVSIAVDYKKLVVGMKKLKRAINYFRKEKGSIASLY